MRKAFGILGSILVSFCILPGLGSEVPAQENPNLLPALQPQTESRFIVQFSTPPVSLLNGKSTQAKLNAKRAVATEHERFGQDLLRLRGAGGKSTGAGTFPLFRREYDTVINGVAVVLTPDEIDGVEKLPYVTSIEPDQPVEAILTDSVAQIGADQVHTKYGATGAGIVVAVIDTGIDYTHPDLGGGFGAGFKVKGGYDFIEEDDDPIDDNGHGTHCAGIVAAKGAVNGVAPDAGLFAIKVLTYSGSGWSSDTIAGIEWAVDPDDNPGTDDGADVISLSLGSRYGSPIDAQATAVNNASAAGIVCVAGAGNDGPDYKMILSPAAAAKAIAVGAVDKSDVLASFSSRGPMFNYFITKPDVCAPGVLINSTNIGGTYRQRTGTSMATPHVSGAVALLREIHPSWSVDQIRSALLGTAVDIGHDIASQGTGRIDVLQAADADVLFNVCPMDLGILTGETYSGNHAFTLKNTGAVSHDVALSVDRADLPLGVDATLTTNSLTLAPGASASVTLHLTADATVDGPVEPPFLFHGFIQASYDAKTIRNPFTFFKEPPDTFEPNNSSAQATAITVTDERRLIQGDGPTRIDSSQPGASNPDQDWYQFQGQGGKTFFALAMCVSVGSSLQEPELRLYNSSLKEIPSYQQPGITYIDRRIIFANLPTTGTYYIKVGKGVSYAPQGFYKLYVNYLPKEVDYWDMPLDDFPYNGTIFGQHMIRDVAFSDGGEALYASTNIMTTNLYDVSGAGSLTYRLFEDAEPLFMDASRDAPVAAIASRNRFSDATWTYNGSTWTRRSPVQSPPRLYNSAMAHDAARGQTILFGGRRIVQWSETDANDQTWAWDGTDWTQLHPATTPPPRSDLMMAYDSDRQVIVMFGSIFTGETWEWNGTDWTQAPTGPKMLSKGLAYDPVRQEMIVIGSPWSSSVIEMWRFKSNTWTQITPAHMPPRATSVDYQMVWDPVSSRILCVTWSPQQTWAWDGTDWTQFAATPGFSVGDIRVAFDASRNKVVLLAQPSASNTAIQYNYTYEWTGSQWSKVSTSSAMPQAGSFALAYDSSRNETVYFGGMYVFNGEGQFRLQQTPSSTPVYEADLFYPNTITGLGVGADGNTILTSHEHGNVEVRNTSGALVRTIDRANKITVKSVSESGNAALFKENNVLVVYDLTSDTLRLGLPADAQHLQLSDDASRVVYAKGAQLRLYDWDGASYQELWQNTLPPSNNDDIGALDIAGDGSLLLVLGRRAIDATDSHEINQYLINANDGEIIRQLHQEKGELIPVDFNPITARVNEDGTLAVSLITGGDKSYAELTAFNPKYPDPVFTLPFHGSAYSVDVSGQKIAAGSFSVAYGSSTASIGTAGRVFFADLSDRDTGKLTSYLENFPTYHNGKELWLNYEAFDLGGHGVKNVRVYYSKEDSPDTAYPDAFTESPLSLDVATLGGDGIYGFYSIAEDNLGNLEAPPATPDGTVIIDLTAPNTPVVSDAGPATNNTSLAFTWSAVSDHGPSGLDEYEYEIADLPGFTPVLTGGTTAQNALQFTGASGSSYYARVRARDKAGNVGTWGESDGILIDTLAPDAPSTPTVAKAHSNKAEIAFEFTAPNDPGGSGTSRLIYQIAPNTNFSTNVYSASVDVPTTGTIYTAQDGKEYHCRVRGIDQAGNIGPYSAISDGILVDLTRPESNVDPLPVLGAVTAPFIVSWQAQDISPTGTPSGLASVSVYWSKDGSPAQLLGTWKDGTSQTSFDPQLHGGTGVYTFYSIATDVAGNIEDLSGTPDAQIQITPNGSLGWITTIH